MGLLIRSTRVFCVAFCLLMSMVSPAFAAMDTQETTFLPQSPLFITSYRTSGLGTNVDFIEIYNSGDEPVSLNDWSLIDVTNNRTLSIDRSQGLVAPDQHVVLSTPGIVIHASYSLGSWSPVVAAPKFIATLRLQHAGYRPSDITLTTKNTDVWMMRTYNTSSYSTTTFETSYRSLYDDGTYVAPSSPLGLEISEIYPYASDCSPLDLSVLCGDYIELHNISTHDIDLEDLVVRTDSNSSSRTISNTFTLSGVLAPKEYRLIYATDDGARISLTNSGGYIWLEDAWNLQAYPEFMTQWPSASSDEHGLAYMRTDEGAWAWTLDPTPGMANVFRAPVPSVTICPEGKYLNPDTGRCRSVEEAVSALATCEEGYERNPTTNRCRKISSGSTTSLTPCSEGQERNPSTNRCRSIASAVAELIPCDEGYERNPATNRCRKMQADGIPPAPFAVQPVSANVPSWQWWVGGVIVAALAGYGIWEWRYELAKLWHRIIKR